MFNDKHKGPRHHHGSGHQRQGDEKYGSSSKRAQLIKFGIVIYETFEAAKKDFETLKTKQNECDQLNIVIKEEGNMDDPELTKFGKVYAGNAWTIIHERRVADGWYNEPHEK